MNDSQNFHMISMTEFRFWQPSHFHESFSNTCTCTHWSPKAFTLNKVHIQHCLMCFMYINNYYALHPSVYICQKSLICLFFFLSRNVMVNTLVRQTSSCPATMLDSYWDHSVQTYSACPYTSALPGNQIRHAPISSPWAKAVERSSLASELAP